LKHEELKMTAHQIKIRKLRAGDGPGVHDAHMRSIREVCIIAHGPDEVRGWGNRAYNARWDHPVSDGVVWVVEKAGRIEGLAYLKITDGQDGGPPLAHIQGLYLTTEVIGNGIGKKLMQLMLNVVKKSRAHEVTLDSSLNAHGFYRRFGFTDSGPLQMKEIGGSMVRGYPMVLRF
jgi:GNAT superfamily N-acetyltransferase